MNSKEIPQNTSQKKNEEKEEKMIIENTKENAVLILENAMVGEKEYNTYDADKILDARKKFAKYGTESELDKVIAKKFYLQTMPDLILSKKKYKCEKDLRILEKVSKIFPNYMGIAHNSELEFFSENNDDIIKEIAGFIIENISRIGMRPEFNETAYYIDKMSAEEKEKLKNEMIKDLKLPISQQKIFSSNGYTSWSIQENGIETIGGMLGCYKFGNMIDFKMVNHEVIMDGEHTTSIGMDINKACQLVEYFKSKGINSIFNVNFSHAFLK